MDRHASRINHVGLTLLGLLFLAAGGLALALGLRVFGRDAASSPVIGGAARRFAEDNGWFWPAVAAAGVVLALVGLAWLLAQARSERLPGLAVEDDPPGSSGGRTRVSDKAVTQALEDEIAAYPGVQGVRARLLGRSGRPRLSLNVAYGQNADLVVLRRRIDREALARLRAALERDVLPTVVRLRLVPGETERTVA